MYSQSADTVPFAASFTAAGFIADVRLSTVHAAGLKEG
jgi:hypothetical protein